VRTVGSRLYGVIGDGGVLRELRHPTMHPMEPLRDGFGICCVRTQLAMDEPLAGLEQELPHLTESVRGYAEVVSRRSPVIYVMVENDVQGACGWRAGRLELGPLRSYGDAPKRRLLRRGEAGAINSALRWLGVPRRRGADRVESLGLADREEWEPREPRPT
jgi:hypothetical protein